MTERSTYGDPPVGASTTRSGHGADDRPGERSAFSFGERKDDEGIPQLLSQLVHQGAHLAEQQTRLVEAEVRAAITDMKESIAALAGAAIFGIAAIGVFLMAISFLLGSFMPVWLGTLIVSVVSMVIAWAMYAAGKRRLKSRSMTMDRTRSTIERTPSAISGHGKEVESGR